MKKTMLSLFATSLLLLNIPLQAATSSSEQSAPSITPQAQTSLNGEVTFYVTRHGKTLFNTEHRVQGWSDTPLTAAGVEVAEQLGRGLHGVHFVDAWSSDSGRARETAAVVLASAGQPLVVKEDTRLRETFFGPYEGEKELLMWQPVAKKLNFADLNTLTQGLSQGKVTLKQMMNTLAELDTSGQTENSAKVNARMQAALHNIAKQVSAAGGGNVLIVSHGMAILSMLDGMTPDANLRQPLQNASVTKITYQDGKYVVSSVGDMQYIEAGRKAELTR